ncbi:MAG: FAD-binding oxidoreductase [Acidimicrobiia bacterium]
MSEAAWLSENGFDEISVAIPDALAKATSAVAPRSIEEVAFVIQSAANKGLSLMPVGSGSTLRGAKADIALVTSNLTGIIDYQPDDLTIVVGAGTTLAGLDAALAPRQQSAVLPEMSPHRTVGGVVAAGASGYSRLRYGPTSDRVLEVVMATGYGEVVRAGGRLVKNVTGYDLSRLATGSFGSLGVIGSVCLKLWPAASVRRTVATDDALACLETLYQPVAVLETETGVSAYVQGTERSVQNDVETLGGLATDGFVWPDPIRSPVLVDVRVPARLVSEALGIVMSMSPERFVAQHGVGVIETGFDSYDESSLGELRTWTRRCGGTVAINAAGLSAEQRWGPPSGAVVVQRRLLDLFDPSGVCNPGIFATRS